MRKFLRKALQAFPRLDKEQIRTLMQDLVEENERLETVLSSMNEAVVVADRDNRIIFANKKAERMVLKKGDYAEELLWESLVDEDIRQFAAQAIREDSREEDREFGIEMNGETRIFLCSLLPLVYEGQIQGNLLVVEDITERRKKDARLRRAESLASLTTMAAGVAHEIKNPLGSMGIHLQLIRKTLNKHDCPEAETLDGFVDVLEEEVERLNQIVVDYLFAVRPMDTDPSPTDINKLLKELLEFVRYELEEAGIEVNLDLEEHLPRMQMDERFIKQALLNIIKNGISAMEEPEGAGGKRLTLSTKLHGDELFLIVSDTGTGISRENLDKIFEPYFTTKNTGSGLGLTLVYKIIKEHRGDIQITSREGEGSTFTLVFPVPAGERKLLRGPGEETEAPHHG